MGWMLPAAIIGSSLFSSSAASDAASTAAGASQAATDASIAEQQRQFNISQQNLQPFLAAGTGAVNRLGAGVAPGGEFGSATPFNFQYDQNTDPGYGFRFDQGMKSLNASMAAKGLGVSGAGIKGAIDYGQGMGSQEYNNAFNRYVTGFNANTASQNNLYNRLAGVAGTGQTAGNSVATLGANTSSNIGSSLMSNAANQGNAAMTAAANTTSAFGQGANALGKLYGSNNYGNSTYEPYTYIQQGA